MIEREFLVNVVAFLIGLCVGVGFTTLYVWYVERMNLKKRLKALPKVCKEMESEYRYAKWGR